MGSTELSIFGIASIVAWIIVGIRLMRLCEASGVSNGWFSFVPLLNFTRWARLAGKNPWLVLLFFIPVVGVILELIWLNIISKHTQTQSPWFWVFLVITLGGWGVVSIFSGALLIVAIIVIAALQVASQWMIFDPTKPITTAPAAS